MHLLHERKPHSLGFPHHALGRGPDAQGGDRRPSRRGARAHARAHRAALRRAAQPRLLPILSPLVWDLGHIANFEELWLTQQIGGREPLRGELGRFYDAIENPRATRNELPILRGDECLAYIADVRERALEVLDEVELDPEQPLLRDGFAYEMLIAHEHQHNETMLQLLQMVESYEPVEADEAARAEPVSDGPEMVRVEGGEVEIGAGAEGFAYDNERPRHAREIEPFSIDRTPVTNGDYAAYVAETGAEPPMYWERDGEGGWVTTAMGDAPRGRPGAAGRPRLVARGRRVRALGRQAASDRARVGGGGRGGDRERANLDHLAFGCAPAGAYGDASSDCGAVQMLGDVWEWTSSDFEAYPGFEAFPYPEYSEVFYGDEHKVLRGGAWATRRNVIRTTFRNWDLPERRQIFAGIRCASNE